MSAEPALKMAADFVRIAVANFQVGWSPAVESELISQGLTLTDLHNSLLNCQAIWTNKSEAVGALFELTGETTEGMVLLIRLSIDSDRRRVFITEVY